MSFTQERVLEIGVLYRLKINAWDVNFEGTVFVNDRIDDMFVGEIGNDLGTIHFADSTVEWFEEV